MANGPESYITWEFLNEHPRAMESGYLYIEWNSIPGLYNQKSFLRTLVIEEEEWDHLSNPAQLERYWEPTQDSNNFHQTLALALCWTPFHDCTDTGRRREYVVSVAVVQKPAWHIGLPFTAAVGELQGDCRHDPHTSPCLLASKIPSLSRTLITTGTGPILRVLICMIQGRGTTWEIPRSSFKPFSITLSPPGRICPQRQSFRRHTMTCR